MIERLFILKRTEIFRDLPEEILTSLAGHLDELEVDAGEPVFRKGELSRHIYIVVDGRVRIHDDDRTWGIIDPDEVFGERSALTGRLHGASATAAEDCRLLRLDQDLLYEVMAGNTQVAQGIIRVLLERFQ
jgi:CRP-like cAMP-binding protein